MHKKICQIGIPFILLTVAFLGFILGAYFWFGGYISTKNAFYFAANFLSITGSLMLLKKSWIGVGVTFGIYLLTMLLFEVFVSLGQVFYVGPNGIRDCFELFVHAFNRRL